GGIPRQKAGVSAVEKGIPSKFSELRVIARYCDPTEPGLSPSAQRRLVRLDYASAIAEYVPPCATPITRADARVEAGSQRVPTPQIVRECLEERLYALPFLSTPLVWNDCRSVELDRKSVP